MNQGAGSLPCWRWQAAGNLMRLAVLEGKFFRGLVLVAAFSTGKIFFTRLEFNASSSNLWNGNY